MMRAPMPRIQHPPDDDAVDILRRLEPLLSHLVDSVDQNSVRLTGVETRLTGVETRLDKMDLRLDRFEIAVNAMKVDVARLDGRVSLMPTAWQLMVGVVGLLGVFTAILRFGV